jgi:signal transduction histidine kinase
VNVNLRLDSDGLTISVSDDGDGAALVKEGNGLTGIRERVESLGGQLRTASGAQGGFSLKVWLPQLVSAP